MVNEWVAEMCKVAPVFVGHTMQYSNYSGEIGLFSSGQSLPCLDTVYQEIPWSYFYLDFSIRSLIQYVHGQENIVEESQEFLLVILWSN